VTSIVVAMIVILVVVACTLGLVLLGIEGRGKQRAPKLADRMARAAQHLNGDGGAACAPHQVDRVQPRSLSQSVRPSLALVTRPSSTRE